MKNDFLEKRKKVQHRLGSNPKSNFYEVRKGPFEDKAQQELSARPGWKREVELSTQMRIPHLLYLPTAKDKKEKEVSMGPGKYNIKDFIELGNRRPTSTKSLFEAGTTRPFVKCQQGPSPGTYNPKPPNSRKDFRKNRIEVLDQPGLSDDRSAPYSIPTNQYPGMYEMKSFTENLRSVGTRGPYDIYSGKIGLKLRKSNTVGPGSYTVPSFTDELDRNKSGVISETDRFKNSGDRISQNTLSQISRDANHPGPQSYDVPLRHTRQNFNHKPPPFNINNRKRQAFAPKNLKVDGRYDIERWNKGMGRYSAHHVFKSGSNRFQPIISDQLLAERLGAHGGSS